MAYHNQLQVTLVNGLTRSDINNAPYVIYVLDTQKGIYVGETKDMVSRWFSHQHSAVKQGDRGCNIKIKEALKLGNVTPYIVATAKTESEARAKEALAMLYYGANLNERTECIDHSVRAYFNDLSRVSDTVILRAKRDHGNNDKYSDSDRDTQVCRIVIEKSRKRVLCIDGVNKGIYVECSRSERERFNEGDTVKIKAALTTKRNKPYLVAAKTSVLVKS